MAVRSLIHSSRTVKLGLWTDTIDLTSFAVYKQRDSCGSLAKVEETVGSKLSPRSAPLHLVHGHIRLSIYPLALRIIGNVFSS